MNILTAAEMRACDARTVEQDDSTWQGLMENAGSAVAVFAIHEFPGAKCITILCGKGNNGGDGLVAARHLGSTGKQVHVVLLAAADQLAGEPRAMYEKLPQALKDSSLVVAVEQDLCSADFKSCFGEMDDLSTPSSAPVFIRPCAGWPRRFAKNLRIQIRPWFPLICLRAGMRMQRASMRRLFAPTQSLHSQLPSSRTFLERSTRGPIAVAPIGSPEEAVVSEAGLTWTGASKKIVEASVLSIRTRAVSVMCWSWAARRAKQARPPWHRWAQCARARAW